MSATIHCPYCNADQTVGDFDNYRPLLRQLPGMFQAVHRRAGAPRGGRLPRRRRPLLFRPRVPRHRDGRIGPGITPKEQPCSPYCRN